MNIFTKNYTLEPIFALYKPKIYHNYQLERIYEAVRPEKLAGEGFSKSILRQKKLTNLGLLLNFSYFKHIWGHQIFVAAFRHEKYIWRGERGLKYILTKYGLILTKLDHLLIFLLFLLIYWAKKIFVRPLSLNIYTWRGEGVPEIIPSKDGQTWKILTLSI